MNEKTEINIDDIPKIIDFFILFFEKFSHSPAKKTKEIHIYCW